MASTEPLERAEKGKVSGVVQCDALAAVTVWQAITNDPDATEDLRNAALVPTRELQTPAGAENAAAREAVLRRLAAIAPTTP